MPIDELKSQAYSDQKITVCEKSSGEQIYQIKRMSLILKLLY